MILVLNHLSGNLLPSRADEELTQKIKEAARYFDIRLLNHLIITSEGYYSFADEGLL
jgi:DNA repair protein RadC